MSEELIVRHCSPTLAGIKTGNIFNCSFEDSKAMKNSLRKFNKILVRKGLRIIPLRYQNGRALVYLYRPALLSKDLSHTTALQLLESFGYPVNTPGGCVLQLIKRLEKSGEFPHEIGLFLGYPPEDVCGFIKDPDACKKVGCWKVYGDVQSAEKLFSKYKKCTDIYCDRISKGKSFERLAVAG